MGTVTTCPCLPGTEMLLGGKRTFSVKTQQSQINEVVSHCVHRTHKSFTKKLFWEKTNGSLTKSSQPTEESKLEGQKYRRFSKRNSNTH